MGFSQKNLGIYTYIYIDMVLHDIYVYIYYMIYIYILTFSDIYMNYSGESRHVSWM